MMKLIAPLLLLGTALATAAAAAPPAGVMEQLCARLCGGTWEPDHPAFPDEIRTSKSYALNAAAGTVSGHELTGGGVAGIHVEVAVTYAWDDTMGTLTVRREREGSPAVTGTVALAGDGGFVETLASGRPGESMTTITRFPGADTMIVRSETATPDTHTMGTEQRFVRAAR